MEEVRADPETQAPFGVAKFSATAHTNLATIKVEDPLDVARSQSGALTGLGALLGSELKC